MARAVPAWSAVGGALGCGALANKALVFANPIFEKVGSYAVLAITGLFCITFIANTTVSLLEGVGEATPVVFEYASSKACG